jgi:hypothetical protein
MEFKCRKLVRSVWRSPVAMCLLIRRYNVGAVQCSGVESAKKPAGRDDGTYSRAKSPTFSTVVPEVVIVSFTTQRRTYFFSLLLQWLRCCANFLICLSMVVIVDLDDEPPSPHVPHAPSFHHVKPVHHSLAPAESEDSVREAEERPNPNISGFSAALSCYP